MAEDQGYARPNKVPCTTCGRPIGWLGTQKCDYCWEVETRLEDYLAYPKGREFVRRMLEAAEKKYPAE